MKRHFTNLFLLISFSSLLLPTQSFATEDDDIGAIKGAISRLQEKAALPVQNSSRNLQQIKIVLADVLGLEQKQRGSQRDEAPSTQQVKDTLQPEKEKKQGMSQKVKEVFQQVDGIVKQPAQLLVEKVGQTLARQQVLLEQTQRDMRSILEILEKIAQNQKEFKDTEKETTRLLETMQSSSKEMTRAQLTITTTANALQARMQESAAFFGPKDIGGAISSEGKKEGKAKQLGQQEYQQPAKPEESSLTSRQKPTTEVAPEADQEEADEEADEEGGVDESPLAQLPPKKQSSQQPSASQQQSVVDESPLARGPLKEKPSEKPSASQQKPSTQSQKGRKG